MKKGMIWALALVLLACLIGCGGEPAPRPAEKEGVVYLDPNAVQATAAPTEAPAPAAQPQAAEAVPSEEAESAEPAAAEEPEAEPALELYFESKGVRMEPMMEAAPVLDALGAPMGSFEADSCAYIGKDLFYYYPGFELTVWRAWSASPPSPWRTTP